jgi:hypothetical protein
MRGSTTIRRGLGIVVLVATLAGAGVAAAYVVSRQTAEGRLRVEAQAEPAVAARIVSVSDLHSDRDTESTTYVYDLELKDPETGTPIRMRIREESKYLPRSGEERIRLHPRDRSYAVFADQNTHLVRETAKAYGWGAATFLVVLLIGAYAALSVAGIDRGKSRKKQPATGGETA